MSAAGSARQYDLNGWYEIPRNPISKAGIFPYSARSIKAPDAEANPGRIYRVFRPPDELADPETARSFRLVPWTNDHAMLGDPEKMEGVTRPEEKGVHGTLGEQIEYDPTDRTLYGNLKIWSPSLDDAIEAGKKELSLGFRCVYEFTPGVFEGEQFDAIQRTIRGNHVASVQDGRMGAGVAVLDSLTFAFDAKELASMPAPKKKTTLRAKLMNQLGITDAAAFTAALDAEEDATDGDGEGDKSGMTLEEAAATIAAIAEPLAKLNEGLAAMAPGAAPPPDDQDVGGLDDDMEPQLDAAGNAMVDKDGKPMMKKKGAVADAMPAALAAMDAALKTARAVFAPLKAKHPKLPAVATMDAALTASETKLAGIVAARKPRPATRKTNGTALDALEKKVAAVPTIKDVMKEVAARDTLAKQISNFVGTFDHAEMTLAEVASYGVKKLEIANVAAGQESAALAGFFANRAAPAAAKTATGFAMDSAPKGNKALSDFIAGNAA